MQRPITRGASANSGLIFHIFVQDSTSTTGAGKASIAYSSFTCYYIRNGEAISGAITPQDITTIGTYAAPTANTNIRIKAVDNTNMIGVYEVQIHSDWVNTTNSCQSLTIFLTATGAAAMPIQIPLRADDPQTAKPTNYASLSIDGSGRVDVIKIAGTTQTARDIGASVLLSSGTGTGQLDFTSGVVKANAVQLLGTAWLTPGTAGTPDVNCKLWNGLATVALPLVPTTAGRTLDVSAGGEAGIDWANIGSPTTVVGLSGTTVDTVTTLTGHTPQTGDSYALANGSSGFAAIYGKVDTEIGSIITTLGTPAGASLAADLVTIAGYIDTEVAAIYSRLGAPAGASMSADIAAVKAETASIQSDTNDIQTRIPAALTGGGNMKADTLAINGSTTAAAAQAKGAKAIATAVVGVGSTTTSIVLASVSTAGGALTVGDADQLKGRPFYFDDDTTTTQLRGQGTDITANTTGATPTLTVTALTRAPANGDTITIF